MWSGYRPYLGDLFVEIQLLGCIVFSAGLGSSIQFSASPPVPLLGNLLGHGPGASVW